MKKKLIFHLPLCILIAGLLFQCSSIHINRKQDSQEINEKERYFEKINKVIKDFEFDIAKVENGKIVLYDKARNPTSEIPFGEYDENIKFIYAHKSDNIVYFITSGAVDDEWGIMFVNDGSDSMMDGVGSATRIRGNSYEYDTTHKYMR